jgi:hypothetical protein
MKTTGIFIDNNGNILGWDGKKDNKVYGVTNLEDIAVIKVRDANGLTTQVEDLDQTEVFELPGFQARQDFDASLEEGNKNTDQELGARIWGWGDPEKNQYDYLGTPKTVDNTYKGGNKATFPVIELFMSTAEQSDAMAKKGASGLKYFIHFHNVALWGGEGPTNPTDWQALSNLEDGYGIVPQYKGVASKYDKNPNIYLYRVGKKYAAPSKFS